MCIIYHESHPIQSVGSGACMSMREIPIDWASDSPSTDSQHGSFAYGGTILWNNLDPNVHKIVSPQTFKQKLKHETVYTC